MLRNKKLANTDYHYVVMDWEFFDEMSVSFMTTSKIITLLSLEMFAYYQLHMFVQLVIQSVKKVIFFLMFSCINLNMKSNSTYVCENFNNVSTIGK